MDIGFPEFISLLILQMQYDRTPIYQISQCFFQNCSYQKNTIYQHQNKPETNCSRQNLSHTKKISLSNSKKRKSSLIIDSQSKSQQNKDNNNNLNPIKAEINPQKKLKSKPINYTSLQKQFDELQHHIQKPLDINIKQIPHTHLDKFTSRVHIKNNKLFGNPQNNNQMNMKPNHINKIFYLQEHSLLQKNAYNPQVRPNQNKCIYPKLQQSVQNHQQNNITRKNMGSQTIHNIRQQSQKIIVMQNQHFNVNKLHHSSRVISTIHDSNPNQQNQIFENKLKHSEQLKLHEKQRRHKSTSFIEQCCNHDTNKLNPNSFKIPDFYRNQMNSSLITNKSIQLNQQNLEANIQQSKVIKNFFNPFPNSLAYIKTLKTEQSHGYGSSLL